MSTGRPQNEIPAGGMKTKQVQITIPSTWDRVERLNVRSSLCTGRRVSRCTVVSAHAETLFPVGDKFTLYVIHA